MTSIAHKLGISRSASQPAMRKVPMTGDDMGARQKDDYYGTPAWVTRLLTGRELFAGDVWEPACGHGLIAEELKAAGLGVVATDLVDRGYGTHGVDFLLEQKLLAPNVVTNPPFKLAREFAQHALDLGAAKVALLLKLAFMQGADRSPWLFASGLAKVIVVSRRITFDAGPGRAPFTSNFVDGYGWFIWRAGHRAPTVLEAAGSIRSAGLA